MSEPVNHHFIPQFYLREFSHGKGRQAQVFAFDKETGKTMMPKVRNVGSKRHFNRIDYENLDPNFFETAISDMETIIAPHFRDVIEVQSFPSKEHYISIVNLISHICHRNPKKRDIFNGWYSQMSKAMLEIDAGNPDFLDYENKRIKSIYPQAPLLTPQNIREFIKNEKFQIYPDQTSSIALEFKTLQPIIECTAKRNWRFFISPKDCSFITSDYPVILNWLNPKSTSLFPPGHAIAGTALLFPLSPKILLVGTHEKASGKIYMTKKEVIGINSMLFYNCHRQIYSTDSTFQVQLNEIETVTGEELSRIFHKSK